MAQLADNKNLLFGEHMATKDRITNLLTSFEHYTEDANGEMEAPSKYQMDELFNDFENMAKTNKDVMAQIEAEMKKNVEAGDELMHFLEDDLQLGQDSAGTLENARLAKDNLASALTAISRALRNNKALGANELKELQAQLQSGYDSVNRLQMDVEKHLNALGAKTKEFGNFKTLNQQKMDLLKEQYSQRMNDTLLELSKMEQERDDYEKRVNDLERVMARESKRRDSQSPTAINQQANLELKTKVNALQEEVEQLTVTLDKNHLQINSLTSKNEELMRQVNGALTVDPTLAAKLAAAEEKLAAAEAKLATIASTPVEKPGTPPETARKVQTLTAQVAKLEGQVKSRDDQITVLNKGLKESGSSAKELTALQQQHTVVVKQLAEAQSTISSLQTGLTNAATSSDADASSKIRQLEQKLVEADNSNTSLQSSLSSTTSTLASTTADLTDTKSALAAEQLKTQSLTSLLEDKQKQLVASQNSLSEQKAALNSLIEETSGAEMDQSAEKTKYLQLMAELNAKLAAVVEREAALGEKDILLSTQAQELANQFEELVSKVTSLEEREGNLSSQQENIESLSAEMASKKSALDDAAASFEQQQSSVGTVPAAELAEFQNFRAQLAEFGSIQAALDNLQQKKNALIQIESEVELKEAELKHRQEEFDAASVRVTDLETQLADMEDELRQKETYLAERREKLAANETAFKDAGNQLKSDMAEQEQAAAAAAAAAALKMASALPPSGGGGLTDEQKAMLASVAALQANLAAANESVAALQGQISSLEEERADLLSMLQGTQQQLSNAESSIVSLNTAAASERPGTNSEALRSQVKGYEQQLQAATDLRYKLDQQREDLDAREQKLADRTKEIEDHLASELSRINKMLAQASDSAAHVSNVALDWYKVDMGKSPEQYAHFLTMIENWITGQRSKTYHNPLEAGSKQSPGGSSGYTASLDATHISPLHAIFELHKDQLDAPLRRKLQHAILQAEKFAGIISPTAVRSELVQLQEQTMHRVKQHVNFATEIEVSLIESEKQISVQARKADEHSTVNWSMLRKMLGMHTEKLEKLGEFGGHQISLEQKCAEISKITINFINAAQVTLAEFPDLMDQLDVVSLKMTCDTVEAMLSKASTNYSNLLQKSQTVSKFVETLAVEYERVNSRTMGAGFESQFAPVVSDLWLPPDEDDKADPAEIARLEAEITSLNSELELLKSGHYERLMSSDGSYGGLMFFAFLQEPHFEEKLTILINDFQDLHDACHGKNGQHMKFSDLQKRVDNLNRLKLPLLMKVRSRYGKLHKKWQGERVKRMKELSLAGGDGDVAAVCPICNVDKRNVKNDERHAGKELKGGTGSLSKKIEKPVKQLGVAAKVGSIGRKWSTQTKLHKANHKLGLGGGTGGASPKRVGAGGYLAAPERSDFDLDDLSVGTAGTGVATLTPLKQPPLAAALSPLTIVGGNDGRNERENSERMGAPPAGLIVSLSKQEEQRGPGSSSKQTRTPPRKSREAGSRSGINEPAGKLGTPGRSGGGGTPGRNNLPRSAARSGGGGSRNKAQKAAADRESPTEAMERVGWDFDEGGAGGGGDFFSEFGDQSSPVPMNLFSPS
jgi:chromosome segregation ATPase